MNQRNTTRCLLGLGAIGPLLFVGVFLVEGATRPGYNPWHNTVSQLALGSRGWVQIANFVVAGLGSLGFAVGLGRSLRPGGGRSWAPTLLAVFGLGTILAGLFVTDPGLGYPPGTNAKGLQTVEGTLHWLASLLMCASVAGAAFALARRFPRDRAWERWPAYSRATGILLPIFFVLSSAASMLDEAGALPFAPVGLLQRIAIVLGCSWTALLALRLLRQNDVANRPTSQGQSARG